ncbi:PITH domain-domain-containing protein [Naematelia encephala]|uniref:Thioredoxin n=1 Tax=Naematelia encephala TaxID=71784 RepID=A0A1Y2ARD5_9TREE|nr:PITH domain-domain-containing protein [Naematelia encephala]
MNSYLIAFIIFIAFYVVPKLLQPRYPPRDPSMVPDVTEIQSTSQYDGIVKSLSPSQLLVIDFHATWCGPCHAIAPVYDELATRFTHVKFVKIDVDGQRELAQRFGIRAMPTFKFIKAGREIAEIKGANPPQLKSLVSQHAGPVPAPSTSSKPATTTATTSSSSTTTTTTPAEGSLLSHITSKGLSCLNESSAHPLSSIIGPSRGSKGTSYLESDVDPQLLISIPFNEPVKLKSISIFSAIAPEQAPKAIKLYINHLSLDFGDADTQQATQEIALSPEDVKGNKVDLRFVRFQNVRSLHILIEDNQGGEETTRIDSIDLFGTLSEVTDKGPLPKHEHEH